MENNISACNLGMNFDISEKARERFFLSAR
jgi:hypothetical protein